MEDELIALLSTLKYPVIRQGSLAKDEAYPDSFFTFWNDYEDGESFYDNETGSVDHAFSVNAYSNQPAVAYAMISDARALLKANGWIVTGRGYDVPSDVITHVGRGFTVNYLEFLKI